MKEKYENLLKNQHVAEGKIAQLEEHLETSREAIELILDHIGVMNEAITNLTDQVKPEPQQISIQMPWPGWEPYETGHADSKERSD